jgi:hypothetical protein
LPKAE